jgi:hypothetical protein
VAGSQGRAVSSREVTIAGYLALLGLGLLVQVAGWA